MADNEKRRKDRERKKAGKKPPKQRQKSGATDIRKHKCAQEVERSVMSGKTKTTYFRCSTCHVSMGIKTEDL